MTVDSGKVEVSGDASASHHFAEEDVLVRVWTVAHELPEEGKLALFDATASELVILNALGAEFWSRMDGVRTLRDIAVEISGEVQEAPAPEAVLEASRPFLIQLMLRGALARR